MNSRVRNRLEFSLSFSTKHNYKKRIEKNSNLIQFKLFCLLDYDKIVCVLHITCILQPNNKSCLQKPPKRIQYVRNFIAIVLFKRTHNGLLMLCDAVWWNTKSFGIMIFYLLNLISEEEMTSFCWGF